MGDVESINHLFVTCPFSHHILGEMAQHLNLSIPNCPVMRDYSGPHGGAVPLISNKGFNGTLWREFGENVIILYLTKSEPEFPVKGSGTTLLD